MTDRDTFIAAIAANPDDDTPRLAFADWLQEHGDAVRAGFIRDQIQLAKLRPGTDEYRQLFRRTADTLKANLPAWIQTACDAFGQPTEWGPRKAVGNGLALDLDTRTSEQFEQGQARKLGLTSIQFLRGFIERIRIQFSQLENGSSIERLFRECPVTRLSSEFPAGRSWKTVTTPSLKQVRSLQLENFTTAENADTFFGDSAWTGISKLSLSYPSVQVIQSLCAAPFVKRLVGLRIPCHAEYIQALTKFPLDDRLQEFTLAVSPHPLDSGERQLVVAGLSVISFRPTLKKLDLTGCTIGDRGLATFARGDVWIRLRTLVLDRNRFGDPGWRDFVRGRRTPELRTLSASRNFLTNDGAVRLGESPLVETLEYIDLRGNRIEGKGAIALARHLADGPLKKLLLAGNPISPKDAEVLRKVLGERVTM